MPSGSATLSLSCCCFTKHAHGAIGAAAVAATAATAARSRTCVTLKLNCTRSVLLFCAASGVVMKPLRSDNIWLFTLSSSRRIHALVLNRAVDETYSLMLPRVAFLQAPQDCCCQ